MGRLGIIAAAVTLAAAAFAVEVVLQPGPTKGKDAEIMSASPNTNFDSGSYAQNLISNTSPPQEHRGLVEFDLSDIPSHVTINSAILDLYNRLNNPNEAFAIYRITASWDEHTVTWNDQPAHDGYVWASTVINGPGHYTWDITTLVQQWNNEVYMNYGFKVIKPSGNITGWPFIPSSDYPNADIRPKLTVNYTGNDVAPTSLGRIKALLK